MTRKEAIRHERTLRARGVYKPFVTSDGDTFIVESYPLTAYVKDGGCDPDMGPVQNIKITDCSLARIQPSDWTIATSRLYIGQDLLGRVADLITAFHGPAHERAMQQDAEV